jgi:hypothetical protein
MKTSQLASLPPARSIYAEAHGSLLQKAQLSDIIPAMYANGSDRCSRPLHKSVILSEAPRRFIARRRASGAESKDLDDARWPKYPLKLFSHEAMNDRPLVVHIGRTFLPEEWELSHPAVSKVMKKPYRVFLPPCTSIRRACSQ